MSIETIRSDFEFLDEWEDRYRYIIELGRKLDPLPEDRRTDSNKVQGCASQVWLSTSVTKKNGEEAHLEFLGDSDAHIVRGLIAILFAMYSGKSARQILATDAHQVFNDLGLGEHLTPQRSNGFSSMVERVRRDAQEALSEAQAS